MDKYTTMKPKNTPFSAKKIPYTVSLILLTVGASLILGFLSFSGMFALIPALSFAFGAFGLSVAYEGEIYLQNIKGALQKLLKANYLENFLAKEYLLTHFPTDTNATDCPQFFKDYETQLKLLSAFGHKILNKDSKKRKKQVEQTLKDMEKWFAIQLFTKNTASENNQSEYAQQLRQWLAKHQQKEWQTKHGQRFIIFQGVKVFSLLASVFMGLGTSYLIVEAFSVIPLFASIPFVFWPILILPMAIIAGAAYGMLTFNTVTDLINNDTIHKWYNKLRDELSQGLTVRNVFLTLTAVLLVVLAVGLTICTAGTWWTIASNARPLFSWMSNMPNFIMGIINPIITGLSAIFFNIQNSAESLEMVDDATKTEGNIFEKIWDYISQAYNHLLATENWLQILNPFRIPLKLTITPLRIIFFLGHLISIAVTADRMPGVPQILSAIIAIISEGFEDAHYFIGHSHGDDHHHHHDTQTLLKEHLGASHGHNHSLDIPTWILTTLATPIYFLSAVWDHMSSQLNDSGIETAETQEHQPKEPKVLSFNEAWNKQTGKKEEKRSTIKIQFKASIY